MQYYIAWFLEILAYCAVNVFAIITGYLMIDRTPKYSRIISLWLQVAFYNVVFTAIKGVLFPGNVGIKMILKAVFPVIYGPYWYFTAYFGMFFLIPYLNRLFRSLAQREALVMLGIMGALFCVLGLKSDTFKIDKGYSMWWLCAMYLVGAYLRVYDSIKINNNWFLLGYIVFGLLTLLSMPVIRFVMERVSPEVYTGRLLVNYVSPMIVAMAIMLVLFFSRVEIPSWLKRVVAYLSPLSFFVYIIHLHSTIYPLIVETKFAYLAQRSIPEMVFTVLFSAIIIYAGCTVIEFLRLTLFRIMKVDKIAKKIGGKMDNWFSGFSQLGALNK